MHRDVMHLKLSPEPRSSRPNEAQPNAVRGTLYAVRTNLLREFVIDHIDRNPLDNRRANLRLATIAQNNMNKRSRPGVSKFKGVIYRARKKLWVARITVNRKRKYIKSCKSEIDAAKAYDEAAKKYYGQFAYLNFPPTQKPKGLRDKITNALGQQPRNKLRG